LKLTVDKFIPSRGKELEF